MLPIRIIYIKSAVRWWDDDELAGNAFMGKRNQEKKKFCFRLGSGSSGVGQMFFMEFFSKCPVRNVGHLSRVLQKRDPEGSFPDES